MQLTVDLSGMRPDARNGFVRSVRHEDRARYALGLLEQRRMKQQADEVAKAKYKGDMRVQMVMSEDQWKRVMNDYGQNCFMDPDFVPWLLKQQENRDMRVKDPGSKIMTGWTPSSRRREEAESPSLPRGLHG